MGTLFGSQSGVEFSVSSFSIGRFSLSGQEHTQMDDTHTQLPVKLAGFLFDVLSRHCLGL